MAYAREQASFLNGHRGGRLASRLGLPEQLQGYLAIEQGIPGTIALAERTLADPPEQRE